MLCGRTQTSPCAFLCGNSRKLLLQPHHMHERCRLCARVYRLPQVSFLSGLVPSRYFLPPTPPFSFLHPSPSGGGAAVCCCMWLATNCHTHPVRARDIGHAWKTDYGCSEVPEEFQWLVKYSPIHNVKPGMAQHPAMLVRTIGGRDCYPHATRLMCTLKTFHVT